MSVAKNVIISQEALRFLVHERRKGDAKIVIHRDDPPISCCNEQPTTFIISLKVMYGENPNDSSFVTYDKSYGIPVWIEKRLLSYLENKPVLISLKKGLFKRLKIEVGSEILQSQ
jgi:hypothetical protein